MGTVAPAKPAERTKRRELARRLLQRNFGRGFGSEKKAGLSFRGDAAGAGDGGGEMLILRGGR